jgi:hypothetical protein
MALSTTYYFHAGVNAAISGDIVFDGDTYVRLPIQAEGFEYSNTGTLPRPTLTVANLGGEISALLLLANAFTPGNVHECCLAPRSAEPRPRWEGRAGSRFELGQHALGVQRLNKPAGRAGDLFG